MKASASRVSQNGTRPDTSRDLAETYCSWGLSVAEYVTWIFFFFYKIPSANLEPVPMLPVRKLELDNQAVY